MFTTLIVQPIFNILVLIAAVLPGHNFGAAIIIFTIFIRILLYPLLKKQLHHSKAMRELAPEIKKIKAAAKGDRRQESMMTMELYKEREIKPFASLGIILLQIPILIGLYLALQKIIKDPYVLVTFSYGFMQDFGWLKELAADINNFDETLFGLMSLAKPAIGPDGWYVPALILCAATALMQYFQSKMLMPNTKDARGLRKLLKEAGQGKQADQAEVGAAVGKTMIYLIPAIVFLISLQLAAALPLYWFTSSAVAYLQQKHILKQDVEEASAVASKTETTKPASQETAKPKNTKARKHTKKRRRK